MTPLPLRRRLPIFLICVCLIAMTGTGCRKDKKVALIPASGTSSSDESLYKLGESVIKKDSEKGLLYLRQLIDSFPKSFYAQRAKLLIADTYFKKKDDSNLMLAAAEYREFIRSYPYSPSAAYCQYQIAMTFYIKALKPGRDQSKTIQAVDEFKKVVAEYPASEQARLSQDKIKECEGRLAEHNFVIAVQYYKQKAYRASLDRLNEIMSTYPNFEKMGELYFYMGDCNYFLKKYDEARPFFIKVVTDYPNEKIAKKAQQRQKQMEGLKTVAPVEKKLPEKK